MFNLQGDVTGIVDTDGNLVLEYKYIAWGKVLSITGSKAGTVGQINPLWVQGLPVRQRNGAVLPEEPVLQPGVGPVHLRGRRAWQDGRTARA